MKRSVRWFNNIATQDSRSKVATLSVLAKAGPTTSSEPRPDKNQSGKSYFKVGKSVVGGEEVVG